MVFTFVPTGILARFGVTGTFAWHTNVIVSHCLLLAGILLTPALELLEQLPHQCLSKVVLGIRCPGCGITTCLKAASAGELQQAVYSNPAGLGVIVGLAVQTALHVLALCWPRSSERVTRSSIALGWLVLEVLLAVWVFRLVHDFFSV